MINDDEFSQHLDQAHLELASKGADLGALLNVAGPLEKREKKKHPAARALVTKAWAAHVAPRDFAVQMERALDRDLDLTDPDAAWSVLTDKLETSAKALADELVLYGYRKVKKPSAKVAGRLALWLAANPKALPAIHHAAFLKKMGKGPKPKPLPYKATDLTKLPSPIAEAISAARTASWKAELRLPAGASRAAIEAAEKTLGTRLNPELRAFYGLHDGAGGDEIFRGQTLLSLKGAVAQRKTLASYAAQGGRPVDPAWLPITADGAGNHDCVVLSGKQAGQVVDFDHETGGGRVISKSVAAYLKSAKWGEVQQVRSSEGPHDGAGNDALGSALFFRSRRKPFHAGVGQIRTLGVHHQPLLRGDDDQVHVLHGDGAQEHLIAQHEGTHEALAVLEGDPERAHVGNRLSLAVGESDFPLVGDLELQLELNVSGDAQHQGAGIHGGLDLHRRERRLRRV